MKEELKSREDATPIRSKNARRGAYQAQHPQEQFIVPLLQQHIADFTQRFLAAALPGSSLLDVGCGSQPLRPDVEALGLSYYGLDVVEIDGIALDFVCGIDTELPASLAGKSFDFILCTEVLEHVADWPCAFGNLSRLLADGGVILITCPHVYQLHEEPFDFYRPTVHAIRHFGKQNHLDVVEIRKSGTVWDVIGTVLANCNFYPRVGRFTDRWIGRLAESFRRWTLRRLDSGWMQKWVAGDCAIYLSNVAILRKLPSRGDS